MTCIRRLFKLRLNPLILSFSLFIQMFQFYATCMQQTNDDGLVHVKHVRHH